MSHRPMEGASAPLPFWTPIASFADAIEQAGLGRPEIQADGALHRFRTTDDRPGCLSGWYCLHLDRVPAGAFGSWKTGETQTWCAKSRDTLTPSERDTARALFERIRRQRQTEQANQQAQAARSATWIWRACPPAPASHPYLIAKGIRPHHARLDRRGWLVIPLGDGSRLTSLQFIAPDGSKRFLPGGRIAGCWCSIQGDRPEPILIGEGFATMATLREQTGQTAVVAFNAGNLLPVSQAIRQRHPHAEIILCADDDRWTQGNPGRTKAREAALAIGAKLLMPDFTGMDLSTRPTDFNDLYRLARVSGRSQL